jgi:hypothetical protein
LTAFYRCRLTIIAQHLTDTSQKVSTNYKPNSCSVVDLELPKAEKIAQHLTCTQVRK